MHPHPMRTARDARRPVRRLKSRTPRCPWHLQAQARSTGWSIPPKIMPARLWAKIPTPPTKPTGRISPVGAGVGVRPYSPTIGAYWPLHCGMCLPYPACETTDCCHDRTPSLRPRLALSAARRYARSQGSPYRHRAGRDQAQTRPTTRAEGSGSGRRHSRHDRHAFLWSARPKGPGHSADRLRWRIYAALKSSASISIGMILMKAKAGSPSKNRV